MIEVYFKMLRDGNALAILCILNKVSNYSKLSLPNVFMYG